MTTVVVHQGTGQEPTPEREQQASDVAGVPSSGRQSAATEFPAAARSTEGSVRSADPTAQVAQVRSAHAVEPVQRYEPGTGAAMGGVLTGVAVALAISAFVGWSGLSRFGAALRGVVGGAAPRRRGTFVVVEKRQRS